MTSQFSIIPEWISSESGPQEVRQTSARLRITLDGHVVTRVEDDWSKSVRNEVFLSAYPLALWFAASWWRLRWEPALAGSPSVAWRMAHETAAAGYGFVWPRLVFESDGEAVEVLCHRTNAHPTEPIRYLEDFRESVPVKVFERTIDAFIALVLARLDTVGLSNTELAGIWQELLEERTDPEASVYRRLEAQLGFEPDEAPAETVRRLMTLSSEAGEAAIAEIALVCSGVDPDQRLTEVIEFARSQGIEGRIQLPNDLSQLLERSEFQQSAPWDRGRLLARHARASWALWTDRIEDTTLSDMLNVDIHSEQLTTSAKQPLGLGVRNGSPHCVKFLFHRRHHSARRFEAARFLADILAAPAEDHWLPATDTKTARQKLQRAFAAEFLCPIIKLREYLNGDLSDEAIEEAGEYFDVSSVMVHSHLANNGLLPRF
jgi:hypothetical protein